MRPLNFPTTFSVVAAPESSSFFELKNPLLAPLD